MPEYQNSISVLFERLFGSQEIILNMKEKFPYTTVFASSDLKVFSPSQDDIYLANASIENLKKYLEGDVDLEKNYDLLGVVFNAFVVNRVNKNDQVIATEDALNMVHNFKYKPLNIEHDRESIVGLITGFGFSEFGTDNILTEEQVKASKDPFNVVLKGFVWKIANKSFAEKLEASADPSSEYHMKISTSWELGFRQFKAVKGSKNLFECEDVELSSIDEAKAVLKHFGGSGVDKDGDPVYIQIVGEVLPLGVGFTTNPAADVKGVLVSSKEKNSENEAKSSENNKKELKNDERISQLEKNNVIANTNKKSLAMLIKKIEDINDGNLGEIKASDVSSFIESELKKASEKWVSEKAEVEAAAEEAKKASEALKLELEAAKKETEEIKEKLEKIEEEAAARAIEESFQARMASLDEEYELTDEDREVIGSQINGMDDEAFSSWAKSFSVIAKEKSKEYKKGLENKEKKEKEGEEDKKGEEAKASSSEGSDPVSDLKEKAGDQIPNNGAEPQKPTLKEMWAKAFNKETVKVVTVEK